MKFTKVSPEEVIECLAGVGTAEWNECLAKRLEPVHAYLDSDEWRKGIAVYLKAVQGGAMAKMLNESLAPDAYQYYRGFIAGLRLVICLPQSIESQIKQAENANAQKVPRGDAGY